MPYSRRRRNNYNSQSIARKIFNYIGVGTTSRGISTSTNYGKNMKSSLSLSSIRYCYERLDENEFYSSKKSGYDYDHHYDYLDRTTGISNNNSTSFGHYNDGLPLKDNACILALPSILSLRMDRTPPPPPPMPILTTTIPTTKKTYCNTPTNATKASMSRQTIHGPVSNIRSISICLPHTDYGDGIDYEKYTMDDIDEGCYDYDHGDYDDDDDDDFDDARVIISNHRYRYPQPYSFDFAPITNDDVYTYDDPVHILRIVNNDENPANKNNYHDDENEIENYVIQHILRIRDDDDMSSSSTLASTEPNVDDVVDVHGQRQQHNYQQQQQQQQPPTPPLDNSDDCEYNNNSILHDLVNFESKQQERQHQQIRMTTATAESSSKAISTASTTTCTVKTKDKGPFTVDQLRTSYHSSTSVTSNDDDDDDDDDDSIDADVEYDYIPVLSPTPTYQDQGQEQEEYYDDANDMYNNDMDDVGIKQDIPISQITSQYKNYYFNNNPITTCYTINKKKKKQLHQQLQLLHQEQQQLQQQNELLLANSNTINHHNFITTTPTRTRLEPPATKSVRFDV